MELNLKDEGVERREEIAMLSVIFHPLLPALLSCQSFCCSLFLFLLFLFLFFFFLLFFSIFLLCVCLKNTTRITFVSFDSQWFPFFSFSHHQRLFTVLLILVHPHFVFLLSVSHARISPDGQRNRLCVKHRQEEKYNNMNCSIC